MKTAVEPTKADLDSFAGVHQSIYELSKRHHEQYGTYLLKYVEDWERVVSDRIHGLLDSLSRTSGECGSLQEEGRRSPSKGGQV